MMASAAAVASQPRAPTQHYSQTGGWKTLQQLLDRQEKCRSMHAIHGFTLDLSFLLDVSNMHALWLVWQHNVPSSSLTNSKPVQICRTAHSAAQLSTCLQGKPARNSVATSDPISNLTTSTRCNLNTSMAAQQAQSNHSMHCRNQHQEPQLHAYGTSEQRLAWKQQPAHSNYRYMLNEHCRHFCRQKGTENTPWASVIVTLLCLYRYPSLVTRIPEHKPLCSNP